MSLWIESLFATCLFFCLFIHWTIMDDPLGYLNDSSQIKTAQHFYSSQHCCYYVSISYNEHVLAQIENRQCSWNRILNSTLARFFSFLWQSSLNIEVLFSPFCPFQSWQAQFLFFFHLSYVSFFSLWMHIILAWNGSKEEVTFQLAELIRKHALETENSAVPY